MAEQQTMTAEAEVVEAPAQEKDGGAVVPASAKQRHVTVFDAEPQEVMKRTAELARSLHDFVTEQKLTTRFGQSEHLQVEAWQFIGLQIGVEHVPGDPVREVLEDPDGIDVGYVCTTELIDRTGRIVGRGKGRCMRSETNWAQSDEYAIESMAQTRSIGKAFRNAYGFIAKAAGYSPTPAEEMDGVERTQKRSATPRQQKPSGGTAQQPRRTPAARGEQAGPRTATEAQQRLIHVRFKQAEAPQQPADDEDVPLAMRAIVRWVTGSPKLSEIPGGKVDDVLEAIEDWQGTIDAISTAAQDTEDPAGAEARAIVEKFLQEV